LRAEQQLADARAALKPGDPKGQQAVTAAEKQVAASWEKVRLAQAALARPSPNYQPLGPVHAAASTGRRLALARWIASKDNPLTARVAVNHIWLRHFGSALVPTVSNFGLNGKPPTHPQLLDWLAVEFMDKNWSMKAIHRLIVTSSTYRMQSASAGPDDPNLRVDRDNQYLWRMNSRRMEAEVVRDSLLHLAGQLEDSMGGPDLDPEKAEVCRRRSVYFRHTPDDTALFLLLFNAADPVECCRRTESIVPQQALALANSGLGLSQARLLAQRLSRQVAREGSPKTDPAFVTAAFEQVLSRPPTDRERARCEDFLRRQAELFGDPGSLKPFAGGMPAEPPPAADPHQRARENLVHVLLNHNDFVTIR
jgi:hypothetical protein